MEIVVMNQGDPRAGEAADLLARARAAWAGSVRREAPGYPILESDLKGRRLQSVIAWDSDRVLGVATITAGGDLSDMALSPDLEKLQATEVGTRLLEAAETWARAQGASQVNFFRPSDHLPGDDDLARRGYRQVQAPSATLRVIDFGSLLIQVAAAARPATAGAAPLVFELTLSDREERALDRRLRIESGGTEIRVRRCGEVPGPSEPVQVSIPSRRLTEFLFGVGTVQSLLARATIQPPEAAAGVGDVLAALRIQSPWFTSLGDRR
jgi:GNAT superfamily N-acetyltransferase